MARANERGGKKPGAGRKPRTREQELVSKYHASNVSGASTAVRPTGVKKAGPGRDWVPAPTLEEALQEQVDTELLVNFDRLSAFHQVVIGRWVMGDTYGKLATEFRMGWKTVRDIVKRNPHAVRQAAAIAGKLTPAEVFSEDLPMARQRMKRVLEGNSKDADAIAVATQVYGYVYGKPVIRTVVDVRGDISITWKRKSDEVIEAEEIE